MKPPKGLYLQKPCKDCPFRKTTLKGWLGEVRITQILDVDSFVCHKNTQCQCAGHMLIKGNQNAFVALAEDLNIDLRLTVKEEVFDTIEACVLHHK